MTNKEFAFLNCISEKEADQILDWFLVNLDEKNIERIADVLIYTVKKSAATIHNLMDACIEIKKITPDYYDIRILEYLGDLANRGINAAKAGEEIAKIIKIIKL